MFTAPAGKEAAILELGRELSVQLTRIGTVDSGTGVLLEDGEGRRTVPGPGGYDHFA
jgi:thiamine-monophosphate kinase